MPSKIEWHPKALGDLRKIDSAQQMHIKTALYELALLDDPRQRLIPYAANLRGFWKLRVGDYRLACQLREQAGQIVLIIHVAHRSTVYSSRGISTIRGRSE